MAQDTGSGEDQDPRADEHKEADEYYDAREFAIAAELFKDAYSEANSKSEKAEITFKLAECYKYMQDYRSAERQYSRAFSLDYGPICVLREADMLKNQGEYEDAIGKYEEYRQLVPADLRGEQGIRSCRQAVDWMENPPTRYQVTNMGRDLNTRDEELAPAYAGKMGRETEMLYFVSNREEATGNEEDGWSQAGFTDIFMIEQQRASRARGRRSSAPEEVSWSAPVQIDGEEEIINTDYHESALCFDKMMKEMYFTRCPREKRAHLGCAIYVAKRSGTNWLPAEPVVLAPDSTYSVGHPSLSEDNTILYFAGALPGSVEDSRDIWMTTYNRRERKWNTPTNLGPIVNTGGDELFPRVHGDGYLYFSSNGLPGMGGLDVWRVKLGEDGMPEGEAENMKWPINSPADDHGLIFDPGDQAAHGYMASTYSERDDHRGGTDLYEVYLVPLEYTISGTIVSSKDGKPVPQVTVTLEGGEAPIVVNTDADGYYMFDRNQLEEGVVYKLTYSKAKFFSGEVSTTTVDIPLAAHELVKDPQGDYYIHNIALSPKIEPIDVPIILPNVLFATAKWDLTPASQAALDTVVDILNRNPNITIELRSHTDYTDDADKNLILSKHRADTCVSYLISKGISPDRLTAVGKGETEPRTIPEGYDGLYSDDFEDGQELTEAWIKRQSKEIQDKANQLNRRTDMKVLRDDYVPSAPVGEDGEVIEAEEEEVVLEPKLHEVQGRESLGRIAREYNVSVRDIKELNGGMRGVRVLPGMILKVTPGADYSEFDRTHYQCERGDDWDKIAEKLGMDADTLEELNPDVDEDQLWPGRYIEIE
ncbi:cell envelope biogenesis protein OmpA [Phaeocystidibacter marisrubri]|nr:cell envelope biogenesis protein OmpA [Phaeocystidibacter marisrubri]